MDNWDRILCFFGLHDLDNDWILRWSNKREYCTCKRCGNQIEATIFNRRSG